MENNIKSILIFRPHFITIQNISEIVKKIKKKYPSTKIFFTASMENLTDKELSILNVIFQSYELIIYDEFNISQFKYLIKLRRQRFDLGILPINPLVYHFPTFYRKIMFISLMSNIKRNLTYNIKINKVQILKKKEIINLLLFIYDLFILIAALVFFPFTLLLLTVFILGRLQIIKNRSSLYKKI